jgi:hypothetical protein
VAEVEDNAREAKASQPVMKQWGGFHPDRENPIRGPDEGFYSQPCSPNPEIVRTKELEQGFNILPAITVMR